MFRQLYMAVSTAIVEPSLVRQHFASCPVLQSNGVKQSDLTENGESSQKAAFPVSLLGKPILFEMARRVKPSLSTDRHRSFIVCFR